MCEFRIVKFIFFVMIIVILFLFVLVGFFVISVFYNSGNPKPYLDKNKKIMANSISEKLFLDINGVKLGLIIKGKNISNPVLLYLHGGMPDYFLSQKYPTGLDEVFTVVWLEQRGSGLSYNQNTQISDVNIANIILDIKEVTNYLKVRFSQKKIYLMGHSGGTYLGIKVIDKYPELFTAYIGIAQISNQKLSEKIAYNYILEQYKSRENRKKIVRILISNPVMMNEELPIEYIKIRDYAMHDLGVGTIHEMKNILTGIFLPSLFFKEYQVNEKINLWRGKARSGISVLWNEIISHDLTTENITFKIPIYFFHGIYDYTCSYELSKEYFNNIIAPRKAFFSFTQSSHSPIFEEPEECITIFKKQILQ